MNVSKIAFLSSASSIFLNNVFDVNYQEGQGIFPLPLPAWGMSTQGFTFPPIMGGKETKFPPFSEVWGEVLPPILQGVGGEVFLLPPQEWRGSFEKSLPGMGGQRRRRKILRYYVINHRFP